MAPLDLSRHTLAVVGAGSIIGHAHLPAYESLGVRLKWIWDLDRDRAEAMAQTVPGLKVATDLDQILADEDVDVVDIAIPPDQQASIAAAAIRAGKHVMCQKPLARTIQEAEGLVVSAEQAHVLLAVQQQMRWEPLVMATRRALDAGRLGTPTAVLSILNWNGDWRAGDWTTREPRGFALFNTVHFLDTLRFVFGEPARLTASLHSDPLQNAGAETWVNVWLEWPTGLNAVILHRGTNWASDNEALWRVEGTLGAIRGQLGIYTDYPPGRPDSGEEISYAGGTWQTVVANESWIPSAFAGPMRSLLEAIDQGGSPATSGRDNLKTLALVEAVYESAAAGCTINLAARTA